MGRYLSYSAWCESISFPQYPMWIFISSQYMTWVISPKQPAVDCYLSQQIVACRIVSDVDHYLLHSAWCGSLPLQQFMMWVATSHTVPAVGRYLSHSAWCGSLSLPQLLLWNVTSPTVPAVGQWVITSSTVPAVGRYISYSDWVVNCLTVTDVGRYLSHSDWCLSLAIG